MLWFPVESEPGVPLRERHLGTAFLWKPAPEEWQVLKEDFDEIIATRKYIKEGDRPCADRGAKMLLIIDKQKGWR